MAQKVETKPPERARWSYVIHIMLDSGKMMEVEGQKYATGDEIKSFANKLCVDYNGVISRVYMREVQNGEVEIKKDRVRNKPAGTLSLPAPSTPPPAPPVPVTPKYPDSFLPVWTESEPKIEPFYVEGT